MWFWIINDHLPLLVVSVLHGFFLHASFLLLLLPRFLTFQPALVFPLVFAIPIFLLRSLPPSVHHLYLDKDCIDDPSTTLEGRISCRVSWTPHLSSHQFSSVTLRK